MLSKKANTSNGAALEKSDSEPWAAIDILMEANFASPLENFGKKIEDLALSGQPLQTQRTGLGIALAELIPEIQQIRLSISTWRALISEVPGIQRNSNQQLKRLENLNYAVGRRSELLQRHRAIFSQITLEGSGSTN